MEELKRHRFFASIDWNVSTIYEEYSARASAVLSFFSGEGLKNTSYSGFVNLYYTVAHSLTLYICCIQCTEKSDHRLCFEVKQGGLLALLEKVRTDLYLYRMHLLYSSHSCGKGLEGKVLS